MADFRREEIEAFGKLDLLARQAVEGFLTGLHKSPYHGFSVEFAEHHQYNTGESSRHIDWKLFGRTDKLFVKRYEEETNLRCQILIDHSSSMYFPQEAEKRSKINFSIHAAATLVNLLKRQRDAFGLTVYSDEVETHLPARSSTVAQKAVYGELESLLQKTPEQSSTNTVNTLHEVAERINRRSLVVIFSDMLDTSEEKEEEAFRALQHLKFNKHEVILFHVLDPSTEVDFDYSNRPHTFVDLETGEKVKLNPRQIQEEYKERMEAFLKRLKVKCAQFKIDLIEADINKGFDQVLLAYLIKRARMY